MDTSVLLNLQLVYDVNLITHMAGLRDRTSILITEPMPIMMDMMILVIEIVIVAAVVNFVVLVIATMVVLVTKVVTEIILAVMVVVETETQLLDMIVTAVVMTIIVIIIVTNLTLMITNRLRHLNLKCCNLINRRKTAPSDLIVVTMIVLMASVPVHLLSHC